MFTGIVREIGRVAEIIPGGASDGRDTRLRISCARPVETIEIGASIACSGVCLTVTETGGTETGDDWFAVDASGETLSKTTLGNWRVGSPVNLEPALRLGDEMGGHIVSGHVDGVGEVTAVTPEGASHRIMIKAPESLARFIAQKGSITVDGISLTVNEVEGVSFGVNIIPHTWQATTLAGAGSGTQVNLEIDLLARYVARLAEAS
ncbi:MAG: riboflavin synthase [Pseudomonadota bacterium]